MSFLMIQAQQKGVAKRRRRTGPGLGVAGSAAMIIDDTD
jgi:hypothetical protein